MIRLKHTIQRMTDDEFATMCDHLSELSHQYTIDTNNSTDFLESLIPFEKSARIKELIKAMEEVRG